MSKPEIVIIVHKVLKWQVNETRVTDQDRDSFSPNRVGKSEDIRLSDYLNSTSRSTSSINRAKLAEL